MRYKRAMINPKTVCHGSFVLIHAKDQGVILFVISIPGAVKDTYISYEASPIPVVYSGIATDTLTEADMQKRIRESHAKYLYADRVEGNPDALFAGMLAGENFEYETFYEIIDTDGALRLVKIQ